MLPVGTSIQINFADEVIEVGTIISAGRSGCKVRTPFKTYTVRWGEISQSHDIFRSVKYYEVKR